MSLTRELVASLRESQLKKRPEPDFLPIAKVLAPPVRVFPKRYEPSSGSSPDIAAHTSALLGIGAVGTRYATHITLQFQAELAVAKGAVDTPLPDDFAAVHGLFPVQSRVQSAREYLLRPDLGRRLDPKSLEAFRAQTPRGHDLQIILADGLSAPACMGSGMELLSATQDAAVALGLRVGLPVCAKFARVWLEDEVGEVASAKVSAILLGERPGLGTGDGLSAYLVYDPKVGRVDSERNMISNIHARGMPPRVAGRRIALLARAMIEQRVSGIHLDLRSLASDLGEAASRSHRAPLVRERLIEVET